MRAMSADTSAHPSTPALRTLSWLGPPPSPSARALLVQCGWELVQHPAPWGVAAAVVERLDAGPGWRVRTERGPVKECAGIPEVVAYICEDLLQAELLAVPAPAGGPSVAPSLDVFEGCLVGIAIGDMVGLGVEGAAMTACEDYTALLRSAGGLRHTMMPWELAVRAAVAAGRPAINSQGKPIDYPFGQVSDDTQCSRELARSIISAGRFSVAAFGGALTALHATDVKGVAGSGIIGQGPTSRATLNKLEAGDSSHGR
jgi:hypothetical protein